MNNDINIVEVTEVTDELANAFGRLLPQLSQKAKPISKADLETIVSSDNALLIATDGDAIVGSLTLVLYKIPTGLKAHIEDVVVDNSCRGKGIGESLIRYAIDKAQQIGAASVDLTSNPNRESANRLYQKMGFKQRETNVYRYIF